MLMVWILATLAAAAAPPVHPAALDCGRSPSAVQRVICGDPELLALREAVALTQGRDAPPVGPLSPETLLPLDTPADRARIRDRYEDALSEEGPSKAVARRGDTFKRTRRAGESGELTIVPLSNGWLYFYLYADWEGGQAGAVNVANIGGVIRLQNGRALHRAEAGDLGFQRVGPDKWIVTQPGECNCGLNVRVDGVYVRRPPRRSPPAARR